MLQSDFGINSGVIPDDAARLIRKRGRVKLNAERIWAKCFDV